MSIAAEDRLLSHAGRVNDPNPEVPERAKRRSYPAKYKLEILAEYETLDRDAKGGLLRREGLYSSLISEWRKQRDKGALEALAVKPGRAPVGPVERENARLRQRVGRLPAECRRVDVRGYTRDAVTVGIGRIGVGDDVFLGDRLEQTKADERRRDPNARSDGTVE